MTNTNERRYLNFIARSYGTRQIATRVQQIAAGGAEMQRGQPALAET
jgi:hypothetical protein